MNGTIQKWGNSGAVRLPKAVLETARLAENDAVEITVVHGNIVIKKTVCRHKTLKERLRGFSGEYSGEELDTGAPMGSEAL